ncbi:MAG: hypothetical protein QMD11_05545, partial [Smithella sp.]|nr:hypothetical protein [Smithella sp.]
SYYGYVADDVAKVEPRLATYGEKEEGIPDTSKVEGFSYGRVAALLHVIVKDNRRRIEELEAMLKKGGSQDVN